MNNKRSNRFTDKHNCPRGIENYCDGEAIWTINDSCSYCGSLHPDIFMERLETGDITLGATDKNYKVYVTSNTNTTKFYFQHLSEDQKYRFIELLNEGKIKFGGGIGFYRLPFFIKQ